MTVPRRGRHVSPVQDPPGTARVQPNAGAPGPWPARAKGLIITGGAAAVPGVPAAVLTLTTRTAAEPAMTALMVTVMVTVVIWSVLVIISRTVAGLYHARQETLRKRIDKHARTAIADALATV